MTAQLTPAEDHRTQYIALTLILWAAIAIFVGSKWEYRDLVNFAQVFGGAGVGILTGQKLQSAQKNNSGDPLLPPNPPQENIK